MDSKSKKKFTSKIRKLDTKSNFIKKNLKLSDSVREALLEEAKLKKKFFNKKNQQWSIEKNFKEAWKGNVHILFISF